MRGIAMLALGALLGCAPHDLEEEGPTLVEPEMVEPERIEPRCEPRLADAPVPLFGELYLVRPPEGVELVDDGNPFFIGAPTPTESSCGVVLRRMAVMILQTEPDRPLHLVVNDMLATLEQQGYTGGVPQHTSVDHRARHYVSVLYPAQGSMPAVELLLAFVVFGDETAVAMFETAEGDLAMLRPSLEASANSLLRLPLQE